jgi:hypothetical protein
LVFSGGEYCWIGVPEFPFSIQTVNDFNEVNPFEDVTAAISKQKFR